MTTNSKQQEKDELKTSCAIILVAPIVFTLMILFAWNVGVEPFFKTLGNISVWQALGLAFALMLLHGLGAAVRGK